MRESTVEQYLVRKIEKCGGEIRKLRWVGRRNAPDRVAFFEHKIYDGNTFWLEVKAPGKKATPSQLREHERMRKQGQQVFVLDSIFAVDAFLAGEL